MPSRGLLGDQNILAVSKHQETLPPVWHSVTTDPLCHPVCLTLSRDAESRRATSQASLVPVKVLHSLSAISCRHHALSLHPHCPLWTDLCHHITALSSFCSAGATGDVQSPTLCCCILFPSRDSNYFWGSIMKLFFQFSYFITVAVTIWPLYLQPVILHNGEWALYSLYDVWFPWWRLLFFGFHNCLQCTEVQNISLN